MRKLIDIVVAMFWRPDPLDGFSSEKTIRWVRIAIVVLIAKGILPESFDVDHALASGQATYEAGKVLAHAVESFWNQALVLGYLLLGEIGKIRERHRQG